MDFYWIDPLDAAKRYICKKQYSGKLYTGYSGGPEEQHRRFDRANSGLVFQAAHLVDIDSSPVLIVFYADASFSGQNRSHHPIYSKDAICFQINNCFSYSASTVSLLNLHEDERSKPSAWMPVGWLPVYNEERDHRPGTGYESASARKHRLYHRCWVEFLDKWAERTKESERLPWADGASRQTRFFLGGVLGDQQEGDRYTGEPCTCHRCWATRDEFLKTETLPPKSMKRMRTRIETYAAGAHLKGSRRNTWIVKWDSDGRNVRPGPGTSTYRCTYTFNLIKSII